MFAERVGRKPRDARAPLTPTERQVRLWDLNCWLATTRRQLAHAEQQETDEDGVVYASERIINLRRERDQLQRRINELTVDRKYWELSHAD